MSDRKPNLIFVFADQWRADATGFAGNPDVHTPHLDALGRRIVALHHGRLRLPRLRAARATVIEQGERMVERWGYEVDDKLTMPYTK